MDAQSDCTSTIFRLQPVLYPFPHRLARRRRHLYASYFVRNLLSLIIKCSILVLKFFLSLLGSKRKDWNMNHTREVIWYCGYCVHRKVIWRACRFIDSIFGFDWDKFDVGGSNWCICLDFAQQEIYLNLWFPWKHHRFELPCSNRIDNICSVC